MKIIKIDYLTLYLLLILFLSGYLLIGLIVMGIVLVHEIGHVLFIKLFKYKIISITIYPFGGITKIDKRINSSINKELLIASGGILIQLILFFIVYLLPIRWYIKSIFYKYNLSIMLFNMIPILPLDGSIIVNSILNKFFSFKRSYIVSGFISIMGIVLYILVNIWYSLNNYLIIGLFVYKLYEYIVNYKYVHNRFLLERYINRLKYKYISTNVGDLDILKIDTYQYFKDGYKLVKEEEKLREIFDNMG